MSGGRERERGKEREQERERVATQSSVNSMDVSNCAVSLSDCTGGTVEVCVGDPHSGFYL